MRTHWFLVAAAAVIVGCAPASAQGGQDVGYGGVPPQGYPPPGMCRIWLDGLAANQQPPVTDCATARRGVESQIRVLDGNQAADVAGGWGFPNDCRDRNRDGTCGNWTSDPRNRSIGSGPMPLMESAVAFARNRSVSDDVRRWVPPSATRVTLQNRPGTNQLYRALWIDRDGKPVQGWVDRKGDGSADLIERYADGNMVETTDAGALQR